MQVIGASKWYGLVLGVNDVSLEVAPGITGLLGPNGAGKSTLLKLMTGELRPSMGDVLVFGRRVASSPRARSWMGSVPETDAFYEEMRGRDFVAALGRISGLSVRQARQRADAVLERVGMAASAHKRIQACSKGMRQRIKIAQALVHDPRILILDEPLSGVDAPGRLEIQALLRELRDEGKTIVISTHILGEVEGVTERVILMQHGRVIAHGGIRQIRALLVDHPLTIRIACRGARNLARRLLELENVSAVSIDPPAGEGRPEGLTIRVLSPEAVLAALPSLALDARVPIHRLEIADDSAEAVFGYLVAARGLGDQPGLA